MKKHSTYCVSKCVFEMCRHLFFTFLCSGNRKKDINLIWALNVLKMQINLDNKISLLFIRVYQT